MRPLIDAEPHRFSTADVFAMLEAGILTPDEKLELIDGELIRVSPKHVRHEYVKAKLTRFLVEKTNERMGIGVETTLFLEDRTFLEPDISIYPLESVRKNLTCADVLLAIEISDSRLRYDLEVKPPLYAAHGLASLWVADVRNPALHVFAEPGPDGYQRYETLSADAALAVPGCPGAVMTLANFLPEID
ncbi:MAG: Uma2 family endonuclease [Maricaulaceae bacterium]